MAATNSPTSNQDNIDVTRLAVVDLKFCLRSPTIFAVRKKPAVPSIVGGRWIIQDSEGREKFKLEELPLKEPGLIVKDSDGKLILTVKPEDKMLNLSGKHQSNVFPTMESVLQAPKPLFTVKTSRDYSKIEVSLTDYKIEGSFAKRIFTISHISRGVAAEVKLNNQLEGTEIDSVYNVEVKTGYDQAFIFGLVAVFEQIRKRRTNS
jgi:uncharacterized protein YxjI